MTINLKNWKTTVQGILSGVVTLGVYFTALPTGVIPQKTAGYITIGTGAAKVLLGLFEKDADNITSSDVEAATVKQQASIIQSVNKE